MDDTRSIAWRNCRLASTIENFDSIATAIVHLNGSPESTHDAKIQQLF